MEQRSDIELIEGAIARNHEAFENLVTRYYRSVYGRIARHTLPWVDRDDIVQETFIAAYEKLAQLKEKRSNLTRPVWTPPAPLSSAALRNRGI